MFYPIFCRPALRTLFLQPLSPPNPTEPYRLCKCKVFACRKLVLMIHNFSLSSYFAFARCNWIVTEKKKPEYSGQCRKTQLTFQHLALNTSKRSFLASCDFQPSCCAFCSQTGSFVSIHGCGFHCVNILQVDSSPQRTLVLVYRTFIKHHVWL